MNATHSPRVIRRRSSAGFTLIELLVVIVILAVLGGLAFTVARRAMNAADATTCLNHLRQSGSALLQHGQESHGRLSLAFGHGDAPESLPYGVVGSIIPPQNFEGSHPRIKAMHCPCAPDPETSHHNAYGVNFHDSEIAGATWKSQDNPGGGSGASERLTLIFATVDNSTRYPLLMDSSIASGDEQFRILEDSHPGLRHGGKANAFFLDGSAKPLDPSELGRLGFDRAYDCTQLPPRPVPLSPS